MTHRMRHRERSPAPLPQQRGRLMTPDYHDEDEAPDYINHETATTPRERDNEDNVSWDTDFEEDEEDSGVASVWTRWISKDPLGVQIMPFLISGAMGRLNFC